MTDPINIYVWATDTAGCFYQRLRMPLDALERAYPDEFRVCWSCEPKSPGVVIGQRIMGNGTEPDPRWTGYCQTPGLLAVYEIDDDIIDLDPGNTLPYQIFTPNRYGTIGNIAVSDHVIASTPNLATKISDLGDGTRPDFVTVAPNCIADGFVVDRAQDIRPLTIGWAGSMFHQQDFTPDVVRQLAKVRDAHREVRWVTIGANYLGWGSHFGWGPIDRYHARLPLVDIGIAPLLRSEFNQSKSWIKALDYMSKGVVPVVEDWGQYPELLDVDQRVGLLVWPDGWAERLSTAIESFSEFDHAAIAARAREYEISRQVHIWANVFRKARDL